MTDPGVTTAPSRAEQTSSAPRRRMSSVQRWMLAVAAIPVAVAVIAAVVGASGPSEPSVQVAAPPGYRAITDAYFGYVLPASWQPNGSATDSTGDYYYQGPSGWAGETLLERSTPPVLGEAPPRALGVFGRTVATPYSLTGGQPTRVPGTDVAWRYDLERAGAVEAQVVDAWSRSSHSEIWLAVHGPARQTAVVLSSLRA